MTWKKVFVCYFFFSCVDENIHWCKAEWKLLTHYFYFYSPKYVHLINQQYYDEDNDPKESAYDLSTTASSSSSSTINPVTVQHHSTVLSRLIQDESAAIKNHIQDTQERLNGLGSSSLKKTHKHSPLPHSFTNSSNLVTVMMDEKNHDSDEHSFYMPPRRDENGHNVEYDEGKPSQSYCVLYIIYFFDLKILTHFHIFIYFFTHIFLLLVYSPHATFSSF